MADRFGYDGAIGWGDETVRGDGAARTHFGEFLSMGLSYDIDRQPAPSFRGRSERRRQDFLKKWDGSVEMEVLFEGYEKWFHHLLGDSDTAVLNASETAKTHTFTQVDGAYPAGLCLESNIGDPTAAHAFQLDGGRVTSATFTAAPNDPFKVTWNVAGRELTLVDETTVVYPNYSGDLLAKGHHITMEIDDVATELDSFELTITTGQDVEKRILGSQFTDVPVRGERTIVEGTFTADWASTVQLLKFINGTDTKVEFIVTGPAMATDTDEDFRIQFILPKVNFSGELPNIGSSGIVKQPCPFFGLSTGTGAADTISIEMDNETASV